MIKTHLKLFAYGLTILTSTGASYATAGDVPSMEERALPPSQQRQVVDEASMVQPMANLALHTPATDESTTHSINLMLQQMATLQKTLLDLKEARSQQPTSHPGSAETNTPDEETPSSSDGRSSPSMGEKLEREAGRLITQMQEQIKRLQERAPIESARALDQIQKELDRFQEKASKEITRLKKQASDFAEKAKKEAKRLEEQAKERVPVEAKRIEEQISKFFGRRK